MITSAYSKSSNPILQKFCKMICEIIVYKMMCGILLIFCRSGFINKCPHTVLKMIYAQINWKNFSFFVKIFFQVLRAFFTAAKPLTWASFFFHKKIILYFFQVWLFSFNTILKICFKNLFRKTVKNWWFYYFK